VGALIQLGRASFEFIGREHDEAARIVRQKKIDTPIVFLTADTDEVTEIQRDRIGGRRISQKADQEGFVPITNKKDPRAMTLRQ